MLVEVFWIVLGGVCSVVAEQRSLSFCEWGIERGEKGGVDLGLSRLTRLMGNSLRVKFTSSIISE